VEEGDTLVRTVKANREHERLLRQQLRPTEVLDGIFAAGASSTIAVTSDRLLVIAPSNPNGWALKSIPWRLVRALESEAHEGAPAGEQVVRLRYSVTAKKPPQWRGGTEPNVLNLDAAPLGELLLVLPEDGGRIEALLGTHVPETPPA